MSDEDSVLDLIVGYITENKQQLSEADQVGIWRTCRFTWLSWQNQARYVCTAAQMRALFRPSHSPACIFKYVRLTDSL